MTQQSLPVSRSDGSVLVEPIDRRSSNAIQKSDDSGFRPEAEQFIEVYVRRNKVVRDVLVLAFLIVFTVCASAVALGMIWRDVSIADSQARIVESREEARVKLAEIEENTAKHSFENQEFGVLILIALGLILLVLVLKNSVIVVGR